MSENNQKKKKRGRKPKNIIQPTQNISNDIKINDNIIIHIKKNETEKESNEIIPGYLKVDDNQYKDFKHSELSCWNCTHVISNRIQYIPLKYSNNIFYTYGNFCSNTCCLRFIIDNFKSNELWEKYGLFKFYNQQIYNKDINFTIPPNRLSLKKFGGNLEIDEYININTNYIELHNPLIIPIKSKINHDENYTIKNKSELKLYRKPKKGKTIFDEMNITK